MIETFRCAFHSGSVLRKPYLSLPSLPSSRSTMAIAIAKFESDSESERDSDLQRCNNNTNNNRTEEDGMNRAYAVFACVPLHKCRGTRAGPARGAPSDDGWRASTWIR